MSTVHRLAPLLVALLTTAVACESTPPASPPRPDASSSPEPVPAPPAEAPDEAPPTDVKPPEPEAPKLDPHTTELLAKMEAVRHGVANKNLEEAAEAVTWLATHPAHPDLKPMKAETAVWQKATKKLATVKRLDQMAPLFAATADACGACHAKAGATVAFAKAGLPDLDGVAKAQMDRHDWATLRLYEALVTRDATLWADGTSILGEESIHGVTPADDPTLKPLFKKWRSLSDKAGKDDSWVHRADFYGQYLQACVTCHEKARELKPAP